MKKKVMGVYLEGKRKKPNDHEDIIEKPAEEDAS